MDNFTYTFTNDKNNNDLSPGTYRWPSKRKYRKLNKRQYKKLTGWIKSWKE